MHNCGYEMEFYDGGDYDDAQATWSCTGCDHVCFVDSETGEIDCECRYEQPLESAVVVDNSNRKFATDAGGGNFVWIPTGNHRGEESGIVGYWDGTLKYDSGEIARAEVEIMGEDGFHYVLADLSHLYIATEADIDAELEEDEIASWREYLKETAA